MKVTEAMYTTLFNGITDACKMLEEGLLILKNAQLKAEEIYISNEDEAE